MADAEPNDRTRLEQVALTGLTDGDQVVNEPLDPEHQQVVDAMRIARLIEEGRA